MARCFTTTLILFVVFTSALAFGDVERLILTSHVGDKFDYAYSSLTYENVWRQGDKFFLYHLSGVTENSVKSPFHPVQRKVKGRHRLPSTAPVT